MPKITKSKKGASVWISWILLFAFAIALSTASYHFIIPHVQDTTESVKKVVFNTDECTQIGLSIENVCQDSTAQHLNITLRNRNYIKIEKLRYQFFGQNNVPLGSNSTKTPFGPNRAKKYTVPTGTSDTITAVKVIPIIYRHELEIVCDEKSAQSSSIPSC